MLNALDIKCIVVKGKATDDLGGSVSADTLHAWNMVKIDGKPYYVDLTWNINISDKDIILHDYFNLTDKDIAIDHYVDKNLPSCKAYDDNYFYKNGLVVTKKSDLRGIVADKIKKGENSVEFKISDGVFENDSDIKKYMFDYFNEILTYPNTSFRLSHSNKSKHNTCYYIWVIK